MDRLKVVLIPGWIINELLYRLICEHYFFRLKYSLVLRYDETFLDQLFTINNMSHYKYSYKNIIYDNTILSRHSMNYFTKALS